VIGFLQPWLLAALPLAALPLLLHLVARREPPTVTFPAVRYLQEATREHQRRLRLRNLLLLIARTLLVLALVLAAAGPTLPAGSPGEHAPTALVIVLDDSPSSGAVVGGRQTLERLRAAARDALGSAAAGDALWLLTADGTPRRGDAASLRAMLDTLEPGDARLDLGQALALASDVLAGDSRPGEILLLTDLQASAISGAELDAPLVVGRPTEEPPPNLGLAGIDAGPQPWTQSGGRLTLIAAGSGTAATPVTSRLGTAAPRQSLVSPGAPAELAVSAPPPGWWTATAELQPDELRADDASVGVVRVMPPASVEWDPGDRWIATALAALADGGRVTPGPGVSVGRLGSGPSIVVPPADPAELGALNRALGRRGVGWRYGDALDAAAAIDSGGPGEGVRVLRRVRLAGQGSGRTGVLATAGGTPWAVRSGDVVLLGSRLEPDWTDLPLSGAFVPFLDGLVNRTVRGEVIHVGGAPGQPLALPDRAEMVRRGDREWRVEGGGRFVPPERGIYAFIAAGDTLGVAAVNVDPRESELARARDRDVRALWDGARIETPEAAAGLAFTGAARVSLRPPLLWLAAFLVLVELMLASAPGGRAVAPSRRPVG
jgi:hypothetical protein